MIVTKFAPAGESAALEFLARSPYENAFLTWLIEQDRSNATRAALHVCLDGAQAVRGVAFFGRQVVLAANCDAAADAFANTGAAFRFERMIVGPRPAVERYWSRARSWHVPARMVRESQPLLAVWRKTLRAGAGAVVARRAQAGEWKEVCANSAQMIEHELGYDPRKYAADFGANVRHMIARGLWWVGESDGQLCFFCNAGPHSVQTVQLQGIWTPPALRGRGLASGALRGICEELLASYPSISLYVNAFNSAALALYDRAGFERVGEFSTLLF